MTCFARRFVGLITAIFLFSASGAGAVTFEVIGTSGANPAGMLPGETITVDVRVTGGGEGLFGLGASAYGYNESVVDYVEGSGQAVDGILHSTCLPPPFGCFDGLTNRIPNPLTESAIGNGSNRVWLFTASRITSTIPNADDPGLDGVVGGGDAQFRMTFEAIAPGSAQIVIGTAYEGDGFVLALGELRQATAAVVEIVVLDDQAPGVPLLQPMLLYPLLPVLLLLAGILGLRRASESRPS